MPDDYDEDDEGLSLDGDLPRPRPSLQRRITRPAEIVEVCEGTPIGDYEIIEQIGEGAMGTVYLAVHPLIGKNVAVKVLKPELCANQGTVDRFVQEAQAVNQIGHPNIVDVFSLGELSDGRAYFVMEWLRGEDLKVRLSRGPLSVQDTCDILDGIARALEAAHAKGIVHRDLKPDNVFLHRVDDGPVMVKLLDFGIAKLMRTQKMERTQTGNMLGTPGYISPEQARGVDVDHRADIYSLGVMAYEMLAGRRPFQGETGMDIVVQHLSETPPELSQFARVPMLLETCVMRMLSKDPEARPTLEVVRQILADPKRRLATLPKGFVRTRRGPVALAIGLVLVAAAVVIGAYTLGGGDDDAQAAVTPQAATPTVIAGATTGSAASIDPAAPDAPPTESASGSASGSAVGSAAGSAAGSASGSAADVAAPEPTPPPGPGTIVVNVAGAKNGVISVDGKEWGRGQAIRVEIAPGTHTVEVKAKGRPTQTKTIEVATGEANIVNIVVPGGPSRPIRPRPGRPKKPKPTVPDTEGLMTPKKR